MTDESKDSPTSPESCSTGSGFYVPGTHDVACDDDHIAHLEHCAHCGATLSPNSEFCQVCAIAVSGGEVAEPGAEGGDVAEAGAEAGDAAAPEGREP